MNTPVRNTAVLQAGHPSERTVLLRRRLYRRNLWTGIGAALLVHLLAVLVFVLIDRLNTEDLDKASGPVLVKIGTPEAPLSPQSDPGPAAEPREAAAGTLRPVREAEAPAASAPPAASPAPQQPAEENMVTESAEAPFAEAPSEAQPLPSRVRGNEEGNNYLIDFEGSDSQVGRAAAYDYIISYMPLPEMLPGEMVDAAQSYLGMSAASVREELLIYWEESFGNYVKKPGAAGTVPLKDRPYYWSLLFSSLNFPSEKADWRTAGMRPVVVEFTVNPSRDTRGARLSDFSVISHADNPAVEEAVLFGLSRWVYYNNTEKPVRGRITYEFDR
ncbi:MAG: hypothetical protein CSA76_05945 [Spirochaetales bacterium]|nr:MAG: hypothetical protein CSA76_05945 [Spirochaetales bacterium]